MTISSTAWTAFLTRLRKVNDAATTKMLRYIELHGMPQTQEQINAAIDYAFGLATKYGEAAAELACQMYDATALASGVMLPASEPAATATMHEVAKAVQGTVKTGNANIVAAAVGRQVKMAGVDTTMQNAIRDGAEWAWIPHGETCAFCITLASRGWQRASKKALRGGHAEHIHANCDCTYAIRYDSRTTVAGYDPDKYLAMYNSTSGSPEDKINAMRRAAYAENKADGLLDSSIMEEINIT
jgi:hypothetical protein